MQLIYNTALILQAYNINTLNNFNNKNYNFKWEKTKSLKNYPKNAV